MPLTFVLVIDVALPTSFTRRPSKARDVAESERAMEKANAIREANSLTHPRVGSAYYNLQIPESSAWDNFRLFDIRLKDARLHHPKLRMYSYKHAPESTILTLVECFVQGAPSCDHSPFLFSGGTGNLHGHLSNHHKELHREAVVNIEGLDLIALSEHTLINKPTTPAQKDHAWTLGFIGFHWGSSIADHKLLRVIAHVTSDGKYSLFSKAKLTTTLIDREVEIVMADLKRDLKKAVAISLNSDMCATKNSGSWITIKGSHIAITHDPSGTVNVTLGTCLFGMQLFPHPHKHTDIQRAINDVLKNFQEECQGKFTSITTDNGAYCYVSLVSAQGTVLSQ